MCAHKLRRPSAARSCSAAHGAPRRRFASRAPSPPPSTEVSRLKTRVLYHRSHRHRCRRHHRHFSLASVQACPGETCRPAPLEETDLYRQWTCAGAAAAMQKVACIRARQVHSEPAWLPDLLLVSRQTSLDPSINSSRLSRPETKFSTQLTCGTRAASLAPATLLAQPQLLKTAS